VLIMNDIESHDAAVSGSDFVQRGLLRPHRAIIGR
jgi:hypothetical protein